MAALAATGLAGCSMGLVTRAAGIDEYALLESVRTTWYDSSGRETDSSRGSQRDLGWTPSNNPYFL